MKRFFTGLRPTNLLHIGNYLGAIEPLVEFQQQREGHIMIADLHAMDTETDPATLRKNILNTTAAYLAGGVDPEKTVLFQQSAVPEHTYGAWVFATLMRMSELERMTQYKDKAIARGENVPVSLFSYPLLMATDILLYDTTVVPVGDDQKQHVELARDIAQRFNATYGETFVVPEVHIRKTGARIMGLDDPTKKMSKSAASQKNYISLTDESDVIRKKVMSAVTDDIGAINYTDDQPGIKNLIDLFSLVTDKAPNEIADAYAGKGYGDLKRDTAEAIIAFIEPLRANILGYVANEAELIRIINEGTEKARATAQEKTALIRERIGIALS